MRFTEPPATIPPMTIAAEKLTVERMGRSVLRDVSMTIADGDCVSIIGPNGAGKSTLLSALLGLLPARSGRVLVDGEPVARMPRRTLAAKIAYVAQIHDGFLGFEVREVVASGRYCHHHPLDGLGETDREAIADAVAATHIEPLLDRTADTLSGGERQKVWIAAALAQKTPVLLLDEPTSALDPAHQADLVGIMRSYAAAANTLVVVCHDLNLPLALGGRVVALKDGAVFMDGPVGGLRDLAALKKLYGADFVLHRAPDGDSVSIHLELPRVP